MSVRQFQKSLSKVKIMSRPEVNVSAKDFVAAVMAQSTREDGKGCIDDLAKALGLTPKSAYARYAKYRREMLEATGKTLPKLPQSAARKATLDWTALAELVPAAPAAVVADDSTVEDTEADDETAMELENVEENELTNA